MQPLWPRVVIITTFKFLHNTHVNFIDTATCGCDGFISTEVLAAPVVYNHMTYQCMSTAKGKNKHEVKSKENSNRTLSPINNNLFTSCGALRELWDLSATTVCLQSDSTASPTELSVDKGFALVFSSLWQVWFWLSTKQIIHSYTLLFTFIQAQTTMPSLISRPITRTDRSYFPPHACWTSMYCWNMKYQLPK